MTNDATMLASLWLCAGGLVMVVVMIWDRYWR